MEVSINEETICEYLSNNPILIENYLNSHLTYNVFFREEDPDERIPDRNLSYDIHLLKTFVTLDRAIQWVLDNGREIIKEHKENYGRPLVITIVPFDNKGEYASDEIPTNMWMISNKRYLTYAFTKEDYEMLLREHKRLLMGDWGMNFIPYWIVYCKKDGTMRRFNMRNLKNIFKDYTYVIDDEIKKEAHKKDLKKFIENPQAYIDDANMNRD